jgi:hypothetical protein
MNEKAPPPVAFHDTVRHWQQADLIALAAEEVLLAIAELVQAPAHDMLGKTMEMRREANRLFAELLACPGTSRANVPLIEADAAYETFEGLRSRRVGDDGNTPRQ